jgi:hypothetical protein
VYRSEREELLSSLLTLLYIERERAVVSRPHTDSHTVIERELLCSVRILLCIGERAELVSSVLTLLYIERERAVVCRPHTDSHTVIERELLCSVHILLQELEISDNSALCI